MPEAAVQASRLEKARRLAELMAQFRLAVAVARTREAEVLRALDSPRTQERIRAIANEKSA
jgi:hypothetical protein